jgi:acetolactate synthase-1/2/3 large subunit
MQKVIRYLLEGVNLVYGYPGETIMPVYDELYKLKMNCSMKSTTNKATHAAQGYEKTGRIRVAIATSGPGA